LAVTAASAVLRAGWTINYNDETARNDLSQALHCLVDYGNEDHVKAIDKVILLSDLEILLNAPDADSRILGLRLLPWVNNADPEIKDRLLAAITDGEREE